MTTALPHPSRCPCRACRGYIFGFLRGFPGDGEGGEAGAFSCAIRDWYAGHNLPTASASNSPASSSALRSVVMAMMSRCFFTSGGILNQYLPRPFESSLAIGPTVSHTCRLRLPMAKLRPEDCTIKHLNFCFFMARMIGQVMYASQAI